MRVVRFHAPGDLRLSEAAEPETGPGDVKIRVRNCSVCGTDLKIFSHGDHRVVTPRVLGHEVAGEISEVGADVAGWQVGDRVQVVAVIPCGRCQDCARGHLTMCPGRQTLGYDRDGGLAEFMVVPGAAIEAGGLIRFPAGVSFEAASLTEPLACVLNGQELTRIGAGEDVVVIGAGPVGCLHVRLARWHGAGRAFLIGLHRPRLELAAALVAPDAAICADEEDPVDEVLRLTEGRGADVVVVAAASAVAQEQALQMAARRGRVSFFAGLPGGGPVTCLDTNLIHYRELGVTGATGSTPAQNARAAELIATGQVAVADLITHRFPLAGIGQAIETIRQGSAIKATVQV